MPLFKKRDQGSGGRGGGGPRTGPVDPGLPDEEWWSQSRQRYERTVDGYYGTPDTMASGGIERVMADDYGTAVCFFSKAVDMLQTQYGYLEMANRRPSGADRPIIEGMVGSLAESLMRHPNAPLDETALTARNYLNGICQLIGPQGHPVDLYAGGRDRIDALLERRSGGGADVPTEVQQRAETITIFLRNMASFATLDQVGRPFGPGTGLEQALDVVRSHFPDDEVRPVGSMMAGTMITELADDDSPVPGKYQVDDVRRVMGIADEVRDEAQNLAGAATTFLGQFASDGENMWELWKRRDDVAAEFFCWHSVAYLRLIEVGVLPPHED